MKRDEMVQILWSETVEHMNCMCCNTDYEIYSKVLQKLEDHGMLPPFSHEIHQKVWRDGGSGYRWDEEE